MGKHFRRTIALTILVLGGTVSLTNAGVDPGSLCKDKKGKETGKDAVGLLKAFGANLKVLNTTKLNFDISKAQSKVTKGFSKAEVPGDCQTTGDVGTIEEKAESFTREIIGSINPICGDNILAPGEDCDEVSDCCSPTCQFEPGGTACNDGNACTNPDSCDQVGNCGGGSLCGNNVLDVGCGEECDGTDDAACPGQCLSGCQCCSGPCCLTFTTGPPGGSCGRINDDAAGTGTDLTPFSQTSSALECGALYIGGGKSLQPPAPTPDNATTIFNVSDCSVATAVILAPATSADTGSNRGCSAAGCLYGPPVPVPNPFAAAISTCLTNSIAGSPAVGGTINATTGGGTLTLPLAVSITINGDLDTVTAGVQPCPRCVSGYCNLGPNAGKSCVTSNAALTTHDCPSTNAFFSTIAVDLSPLSTAGVITASSDVDGRFCGAGQTDPGAFGCPGAVADTTGAARCGGLPTKYIEVNGAVGGSLLATGPVSTTLGSVYCIPATGSPTSDLVASLPGPGSVTLVGDLDLLD